MSEICGCDTPTRGHTLVDPWQAREQVIALTRPLEDIETLRTTHDRGRILATPTDAPGFAALLDPADGLPIETGGVLAHRRAAFERLTCR